MRKIPCIVSLIFFFLFAGSLVFAGDTGTIKLWGKQTAGWGAKNAKTDGNVVKLKKTVEIVRVEGNATSYCIWTGGSSILCGGGKKASIVGKVLSPGRYTVLAGLDGKKEAKITIYLKEK